MIHGIFVRGAVCLAVFCAFALQSGPAPAQSKKWIQAPFGLTWGWHESDFRRNGIILR